MDSVRDSRPLVARGGKQILGTGTRPVVWPRSGRRVSLQLVGHHFYQCAFSMSEISSSSVPTACRRSTRVLKGTIRAEWFFAPLCLRFRFVSRHSVSFAKHISEQIVDVPVPQRVGRMPLAPQIACQRDATPVVSLSTDVERHMSIQMDHAASCIDW